MDYYDNESIRKLRALAERIAQRRAADLEVVELPTKREDCAPVLLDC